MHFITIDTCVWLNLTLERGSAIFDALESLMDSGALQLVHPEIILEEFERNKEARSKEYASVVKKEVKAIKNMLKRFEVIPEGEKQAAHQILDKISNAEKDISKLVEERIGKIVEIINKKTSIKIKSSDDVYRNVVERGLRKAAPFLSKNSTADAIILETFAKSSIESDGNEYHFVTINNSDFSDPKNFKMAHKDIESIFASTNIHFEINIGDLLNKIKEKTVSPETVTEVGKWTLKEYFSYNCPKCGENIETGLTPSPSQYGGWSYWANCQKCGSRWDTGEPYDD